MATVRRGYCEVCVCVRVTVSGALEINSGLRHEQFITGQFERKKVRKAGKTLGVMFDMAQAVAEFGRGLQRRSGCLL